jgi:hypothetical protein
MYVHAYIEEHLTPTTTTKKKKDNKKWDNKY